MSNSSQAGHCTQGAANTIFGSQIAKLEPKIYIKRGNILIWNNGLYFADAWSNLLSERESVTLLLWPPQPFEEEI